MGWLHIASDTGIFLAYCAIPLIIGVYVLRRDDLNFSRIYWLFSAFIFACGITHLLDAIIFWEPVYNLSGIAKAVTAGVSTLTAISLVGVLPKALELPALPAVNRRLQAEIAARQRNEEELKRTGEELGAVNSELERFALMVSHELQEPLRKIAFFSDRLLSGDESLPAGAWREDAERIAGAVQRQRAQVQGLLDLARLGTRRLDRPLPVPLHETVAAASEEVDGELQVENRIDPALLVAGDDHLLRRLFGNLFSNAYRYRHQARPPRVVVAAERRAQAVVITLQDNGIGLPPGSGERAFQPLQRCHSRERSDGLGLGLAICRRIAFAHAGSIEALECACGARFEVTLPGWEGDGS